MRASKMRVLKLFSVVLIILYVVPEFNGLIIIITSQRSPTTSRI